MFIFLRNLTTILNFNIWIEVKLALNAWIRTRIKDALNVVLELQNVIQDFSIDEKPTIKIGIDDQCFIFPDKKPEHTFCTNPDYTLNFYVNHAKVPSITNYVVKDDDRVLVVYGNENQTQIDNYLKELDGLFIEKK